MTFQICQWFEKVWQRQILHSLQQFALRCRPASHPFQQCPYLLTHYVCARQSLWRRQDLFIGLTLVSRCHGRWWRRMYRRTCHVRLLPSCGRQRRYCLYRWILYQLGDVYFDLGYRMCKGILDSDKKWGPQLLLVRQLPHYWMCPPPEQYRQ